MANKSTNDKEPTKPEQSAFVQKLLQEQGRLQAEKEAIVEEFTKQINDRGELFDEEDIKNKVKEVLPDAFAGLKELIKHSESDQVRANLIKYVFDAALLILKKENKGDNVPETVADLVDQLKKND